jgi:two-component system cell cycle sensor histidine kinase/response regulator CckA
MSSGADADLLRRIADGLPVGVWVATAPAGELVYANETFTEIMGTSARNDVEAGGYAEPYGIYGRDGKLYPEDQLPFVRALRERTTLVVDDIVIHRPDGRRVNIRAQARPLFCPEGTITHVVIAFIDITHEVQTEERRRETEQRLARAHKMESIGQLAGGVAHDFNNLLAALQVIASSMRRDASPRQLDDLRRIEEVSASAVQLTRSLLGFAGRASGSSGPVSLNRVVDGVVDLLRRTFDRRIRIEADLSGDAVVTGDHSQLEQVVMNLAVNARDAMPDGGELLIRTREHNGSVVLEVGDTGPGIEPALRERIFEPYFTTKTSGPVRGTGLGLATVYGIVAAMGGIISVHDREPRGSLLRISLPASAVPVRAVVMGSGPTQVARAGGETILLVEDDPLVRTAIAHALSRCGYRVLQAGDGREALEVFASRQAEIDAVVLDANMPRLDGRGTFQAMVEKRRDVRVLLTSGFLRDEDVQEMLGLGIRHFLAKPYDIDRLTHALAVVLSGPPASASEA